MGRPGQPLLCVRGCAERGNGRPGRSIGIAQYFSGVDLRLPRYTLGRTGLYDSPVF
jgi:hypothetical protein